MFDDWLLTLLRAKWLVFGILLVPLVWLVVAAANDALGANPAEALVRSLGDWTLRGICLVLAISPVRVSMNAPSLARYRRMVGLFVFFYAALHMAAYAWFDMGLEWGDMVKDIAKRPFILVGALAFTLLLLMALTSWNRAIRALGARRWQRLHQSVYAVAILSVLHFLWMRAGKNNYSEVFWYALILALLLLWRLWRRYRSLFGGR